MAGAMDELIAVLRLDRQRSAWAQAQTLAGSLVKLQGEIGESLEALAAGDRDALREELGDVLWSLLFALIVAEDEVGTGIDPVAATALIKWHHRKGWLLAADRMATLEEEDARWLAVKRAKPLG